MSEPPTAVEMMDLLCTLLPDSTFGWIDKPTPPPTNRSRFSQQVNNRLYEWTLAEGVWKCEEL